jgi:hypothetical protein
LISIKQVVKDWKENITPKKILTARLVGWGNLVIFLIVLAVGAGAWSIIPLVIMFTGWGYADEHRDEVGMK